MKIPRELPKFKEKSLLIVTGKQTGVFYLAQNITIEAVDAFEVDKPSFSDREGLFANSSGHGTLLQREAGDERHQDEKMRQDFSREMTSKLKNILNYYEIDQVYVFAPSHVKALVISCLSPDLKKRHILTIEGNFTNEHPLKLLEKIKQANDKEEALLKDSLLDEEVLDILHRGEKVKV